MENIGGDVSDTSYRYRMPTIETKVEGRGNGIKTVLPNIEPVCNALKRKPLYLVKYFGNELGSISKYDEKTKLGTVHGAHSWETIHNILLKFINTFVLCQKCNLPETTHEVVDGSLVFTCSACGHHYKGNPSNKLTNFIIQEAQRELKGKKKHRGHKHDKDEEEGEDGAEVEEDAEVVEPEEAPVETAESRAERHERHRRRREALAAAQAAAKAAAARGEGGEEEREGDVEEGGEDRETSDMSPAPSPSGSSLSGSESEKERRHRSREGREKKEAAAAAEPDVAYGLTGKMREMSLSSTKYQKLMIALEGLYYQPESDDDEEEEEEEENEEEEDEEKERKEKKRREKEKRRQRKARLLQFKQTLSGTLHPHVQMPDHPMMEVFDSLFPESVTIQGLVDNRAALLKRKGEMGQLSILIAMERKIVKKRDKAAIAVYPQLLNTLYQNDVVEEPIFVAWHKYPTVSTKYGLSEEKALYMRRKAEEFIEWLTQEDKAEEEEEEEEEEEADKAQLDAMIDDL